ncbi:MAG: ethanolamine ammonia-lyase subunit EutC [Flavobacteriaceae bacterium]|jgi:ethanolamine ammonia-lyase small subunit|nr:ethanolamine ammonia-lyase subunit EutC [Flavobacteriaceae bacterium]
MRNSLIEKNSWSFLKEFTDARIALGRTGVSLPTRELLEFSLAHAKAKDAVHQPFDKKMLEEQINETGLPILKVSSAAKDRTVYLTRPDLGRQLSEESKKLLQSGNNPAVDVVIIIGDGLSSKAVHKQAFPLLKNLLPYISQLDLSLAPIVLAEQSRVALGDEIGEILKARLSVVLIGERPGLSSPDSLGVYMTWDPSVGKLDSERNCISNIRPEGLSYSKSAFKLAWLIEHALYLKATGIHLKDQSDNPSQYRIVKPDTFTIE